MEVEINLFGVFLAGVSAMLVGSVWYSKKVFGETWMKLVRLNEKQAQKEAPRAMTIMFILALTAAYVLAHVAYLSNNFYSGSFFNASITSALWMWLGFVLYSQVSNAVFEQRPKQLIAIHTGGSLLTLLVMGIVIGWVGI